jgi:hypothetical protein
MPRPLLALSEIERKPENTTYRRGIAVQRPSNAMSGGGNPRRGRAPTAPGARHAAKAPPGGGAPGGLRPRAPHRSAICGGERGCNTHEPCGRGAALEEHRHRLGQRSRCEVHTQQRRANMRPSPRVAATLLFREWRWRFSSQSGTHSSQSGGWPAAESDGAAGPPRWDLDTD